MGELKIEKSLTIKDAATAFNRSEAFIRKNIRARVIPVVLFNGKPVKPYRMLYKDLDALFTVASLGSLKIERLGKLALKPSTKEEFKWPK